MSATFKLHMLDPAPGTEDLRVVPWDVPLNELLAARIVERTRQCAQWGHRWSETSSLDLCVHCGAAWLSPTDAA